MVSSGCFPTPQAQGPTCTPACTCRHRHQPCCLLLQVVILEQHKKKKAEYAEWQAVVSGFLHEKEKQAKVRCSPAFRSSGACGRAEACHEQAAQSPWLKCHAGSGCVQHALRLALWPTQDFITSYEKLKKKAIQAVQASPADADTHVLEPKV